jgi:hypothetical protein
MYFFNIYEHIHKYIGKRASTGREEQGRGRDKEYSLNGLRKILQEHLEIEEEVYF